MPTEDLRKLRELQQGITAQPDTGPLRIEITQDASDLEDKEDNSELLLDKLMGLYGQEDGGAGYDVPTGGPSRIGMIDAFSSGVAQGLANKPLVMAGAIPEGYSYDELNSAEGVAYQIGRSLSDNLPFLLMPGALLPRLASVPVQSGRQVTRFREWLEPVVQNFAKHPRSFALAEGGAVAGAAQGRGLAENFMPGDTVAGVVGEMTGSVVNPIGTVARAGRSAMGGVYRMISNWTPAGRERSATEMVQSIARSFGENPEQVARWVSEAADIPGLPGQVIESKTLNAIHKQLLRNNPDYRNLSIDQLSAADQHIRNTIESLFAQGSPDAIQAATRMRQDYFAGQLADLRRTAEHQAEVAVSRMTGGRDAEAAQKLQSEASENVVRELNRAIREAQLVQDGLYPAALRGMDKPPGDLSVDEAYPVVMEILTTIGARGLPGEDYTRTLTAVYGSRIGKSLDDMMAIEAPTPLTVHNMSVAAGNKAATLRNLGRYADAQPFEELRRAALADIDAFDDPLLRTARDYTAAYHRVFDETYVARATPSNRASEIASPSGDMLRRAIAPGGVTARDRLRQLEEASAFATSSGADPEAMARMGFNIRNEQESFLLAHAHKFIKDGEVNNTTLRNFTDNNAALLEDFPNVREILSDVRSTRLALDNLVQEQTLFNKQVVNQNIFTRILNAGESNAATDASTEVGRILSGNPRQGVRRLAEMINDPNLNIPRDERVAARQGMVLSIYEHAASTARRADGTLDWARMNSAINSPVQQGQPTMLELLRNNGVINEIEFNHAKAMFDRAGQMAAATDSPYEVSSLIHETDMIAMLLARASGSMTATRFLRMFSSAGEAGPSLIVAHAGSKAAQKFMGLAPQDKILQIIVQAQSNPQLYQKLLRGTGNMSPAQHHEYILRLNTTLYAAGLTGEVTAEDMDFYNIPNIRDRKENP